jgi:hypothetical protein
MKKIVKILLAVAALSTSLFAADSYQMSICSSDNTKLCYGGKQIFLSGMNIAWFKFSQDVGRGGYEGSLLYVDETLVRKTFKNLRAAGGNTARWWLYTNNAMDPIIDSTTDLTTGIETNTIANVKTVLDMAQEYGVVVSICLLSFDMLKGDEYTPNVAAGWSRYNYDANYKMLTDTSATRAFIKNAVVPLVQEFKDHPALLTWEIFNEPEGMTSTDNFGSGWGTTLVDIKYIQRFINMVADAIHKEAPDNLVSSGSAKTTMTSDVAGTNYYTDARLLASNGNKYSLGTLDFYQVHYYPEWNSNAQSPFHHAASYWNVGKPLVIGEFPAASWTQTSINTNAGSEDRRMTVDSAYAFAYDNGYAGALSWMMYGDTPAFYGSDGTVWGIDSSAPALTALYDAHKDAIMLKDVVIDDHTGENGWMQVTYDNSGENAQISYTKSYDLTGVTSVTFDVINSGTSAITYMLVLQTNATDNWGWYQSETQKCTVAAGDTTTCTFDLANIAKWDDATAIVTPHLNQIAAVYLVATEAYTGTVYIDNIVTNNGIVIQNFDTQYDVFSPAGTEAASISVTTYFDGTKASIPSIAKGLNVSNMYFMNGSLNMTIPTSGNLTVNLFNLKGNCVATLHKGMIKAGAHSFAVKNITQGMYIMQAQGTAGLFTGKVLVK